MKNSVRLYRILLFLACSSFFSCKAVLYSFLIHTPYNTNNIPPVPDYANTKCWAALPDRKDAADTTPDKQYIDEQATAPVDVFFIYPTTYTHKPKGKYDWNGDVNDSYLNEKTDNSTIRYQASVFNGTCKIYAPRYRQAHITAFFTKDTSSARKSLDLAYSDVRTAFEYYLKNYNHGRPFIIASHSQGTHHAKRLIKEMIETDPALMKLFVCAYIIGYAIPDTFFRILKPCSTPTQTQCIITWGTYAAGYTPPWLNHSELNIQVNPLIWTTDTTYAPGYMNKGGILRDFQNVRKGLCDAQIHKGLLWIHKPNVPGAGLVNIKNYHIADYNLFYINIRENVQQRVNAWMQMTNH